MTEENRSLRCSLCSCVVSVSPQLSEWIGSSYYCESCNGVISILNHPHVLYLRADSFEDMKRFSRLLASVSKPYAGFFGVAAQHDYSLSFWYKKAPFPLLQAIMSLRCRYTLYNLQTNTASLSFLAGDPSPKGPLTLLLSHVVHLKKIDTAASPS